MLSILGFAVIVIAAVMAYRGARDNGRSGPLWAGIVVAIGIGLQIILPLLIGIVLAVVYISSGTPQNELQDRLQTPAIILGIVCLGLSIAGMLIALKYANRLPMESDRPPPPPADLSDSQ